MPDSMPAADDARSLGITMLGSGGAFPYARRVNPSVLVADSTAAILLDVGSGVSMRLSQRGVSAADVDLLLLTHLHADHCVELPLLALNAFFSGRTAPIRVRGPEGTSAYVSRIFEEMFPYIPAMIADVLDIRDLVDVYDCSPGPVATVGRIDVSCCNVNHGVPALGFRFDVAGGSVVVSGDTEPCEDLEQLSAGVDLLIHECPFPPDVGHVPGHTTARELGTIARNASPRRVVLTHLFEETCGREHEMIDDVRSTYDGDVVVGEDLLGF